MSLPAARLVLEIVDDPPVEDVQVLGRGLGAFNASRGMPSKRYAFGVFARDGEGSILGGSEAFLIGRTVYVNRVWVADEHRGYGLGRTIMSHLEQEARRRDAGLIWLETLDFQAKPFYEKLGFHVFAELDHAPLVRGDTPARSYFLKKPLD